MNEEKIRKFFPRASKDFIAANRVSSGAKPEQTLRHGTLAENSPKKRNSKRCILKYTSYRQRLLDIDNLAGGTKFFTDALRYCGAISGDSEDQISLAFSQKKVETKAQEKTLIEIIYP